jgi:DNA-binding CsgD family transcriptional regulator
MPANEEPTFSAVQPTRRQQEILGLLVAGMSDKQVAARLGVSRHTVRSHLDRLYSMTGLHNRTALVVAWLRNVKS